MANLAMRYVGKVLGLEVYVRSTNPDVRTTIMERIEDALSHDLHAELLQLRDENASLRRALDIETYTIGNDGTLIAGPRK